MIDAEYQELENRLLFARYLQLPGKFDADVVLREAEPFFREFVVHRESLATNGWRALALRNADGVAESVGRPSLGRSQSRATRVADACPATMAAIEQFSFADRAMRARYMLLEPGAVIPSHRDTEGPMSFTLNLCVTFPTGCRFAVGVDPSGSDGSVVPFAPGTAFLLNVAERHTVRNDSDGSRLHIVIEGPVRLSGDQLLEHIRKATQGISLSGVQTALLHRHLAKRKELDRATNTNSDIVRSEHGAGSSASDVIANSADGYRPTREDLC